MSILSLFRSGRQSCTNSPDWFVGNDHTGPVGTVQGIDVGLDLRKDKIVGRTRFAIFQGFSTTGNHGKTLVESILGLFSHIGVGFSLATTFGMTDNGPFDAQIGQHVGTGFTRKGTVALRPAILGADGDGGGRQIRLDGLQVDLGGTDDDLSVGREGGVVEHGNEVLGHLNGAIALPVAAHKKLAGFRLGGRMKGTKDVRIDSADEIQSSYRVERRLATDTTAWRENIMAGGFLDGGK